MNVKEAIRTARQQLGSTREAHYLVSAFLGLELAALLAYPERVIEDQAGFLRWLAARASGKPLAYLAHRQAFYGRTFQVDERVLIPRPETETLVEMALTWIRSRWFEGCVVADIGTGSGCIAITLALEVPGLHVIATDLSLDALEVAQQNADALGVRERIEFRRGDLLDALSEAVDLIVANLPYVPTPVVQKEPSIAFEPHLALDGGEDGERLIRRLLKQIRADRQGAMAVLLEMDADQMDLVEHAHGLFPESTVSWAPDFSGKPRILRIDGP